MMFLLKLPFWFQICFKSTIPITTKKLRVDELAFFTPAYNSLAVLSISFWERSQQSFLKSVLNTWNMWTSFGAKYIQKTVNYLNLLQISTYFDASREIDFFVTLMTNRFRVNITSLFRPYS